jgi:hypothetical protein
MMSVVQAFLWAVLIGVILFWLYPFLVEPRTQPDSNQSTAEKAGRVTKNAPLKSGEVLTIRLTDDGELVNRTELMDVTYAVRNFRQGPVIALWYIHGWKHNAGRDDSDLKAFWELVGHLAKVQEVLPAERRRHVVGIFIGWDAAAGPQLLRNLTFWNRKRAADRISQSSVVTKLFARVRSARRQRGNPNDLTIYIGHSFGARILYSAISHVLIDEVERLHPGEGKWRYDLIKGPADLVVLLNPAFEASMFTALHAMRRDDDYLQISDRQQPRLLVISTENDFATTVLYPIGQIAGLATRERERKTLGNYDGYVTHDLIAPCPWSQKSRFWYDHFECEDLLLLHRMERDGRLSAKHWGNPFIVARTTRDIIDGHSGIWTPRLRDWILNLVAQVQQQSARVDTPAPAIRKAKQ